MATGQYQTGGLFGLPDAPELGPATWGEMSGVHPDSPMVGGRGTPTGGVDPDFKYRRVALGAATSAPLPGAHAPAHASSLLDFRHNPLPWVLVALIIYLGLVHVSVGGAVGKARAQARIG